MPGLSCEPVSRWTSNTTPDQKAACIRALCDDETSAPVVSAMAARGELAGLPAFEISASSCRRLRTAENERRREASKLSPENREKFLEALDSRILSMLERVVAEIETGQKPSLNLAALRAAQRCLNEHRTGIRHGRIKEAVRAGKLAEPGQGRQQNPETTGSTLAQRLRERAQEGGELHARDSAASSARILNLPTARDLDRSPAA
jgi:hypothetical protein